MIRARVAQHLRDDQKFILPGGSGDPASWSYPALDRLDADVSALAESTRKILFFVPYNQMMMPAAEFARRVGVARMQTARD